jgi:hypothetical protein
VNHSSPIWGIPDSHLTHDALALRQVAATQAGIILMFATFFHEINVIPAQAGT